MARRIVGFSFRFRGPPDFCARDLSAGCSAVLWTFFPAVRYDFLLQKQSRLLVMLQSWTVRGHNMPAKQCAGLQKHHTRRSASRKRDSTGFGKTRRGTLPEVKIWCMTQNRVCGVQTKPTAPRPSRFRFANGNKHINCTARRMLGLMNKHN